MFFITGCKSDEETYREQNTEHMLTYINQADSMRLNIGNKAALDFINDTYHSNTSIASTRDWINYFQFKFQILKNTNPQKALLTADSMLLLLEKSELKEAFAKEYMAALYSKGDVYFILKEYNQAFDYYYRGKLIAEGKLSECEKGDFSFRVAMVLYQQRRYVEAASYFKDCFNKEIICNNHFLTVFRCQEVLDNIGLSYSRAGMEDSALLYFNDCIKFIDLHQKNYKGNIYYETSFKEARAVAQGNIADVLIKKKNYHLSEKMLQESIAENGGKGNNTEDAEFSLGKLAELYINTNKLTEANAVLGNMKAMLDSVPNLEAKQNWYRLTSAYYEKNGDPVNSLAALKKFVELNNTRQAEIQQLGKSDLVERVNMLGNIHKIDKLQHENDSKAMYLLVEGLVLLMAILIFILIYNNWKKSRRYIKLLTSLNNKARQQRKELKIALEQLEKSNKGKDKILRIVAHDIRNPIAGISMLSEMLLHDDTLNEEQHENMKLIKMACENALTLTKEILEVATEFLPEKWVMMREDVKTLLLGQIELLRYRAAEKKQKIVLEIPDHPVFAVLNKEKISRVITNVVINAIKFSPEESQIEVMLKERKDQILLVVKDYGIGIPDNYKEKIFEMFTEAKRFGTSGEKPFGLGLSICKQIVEAHSGKIWAESKEEKGTTFFISLPYERVPDQQ